MRNDQPGAAPNFTSAVIFMFGVNVAWVFVVVWATWGLLHVILLAVALDYAIIRLHKRALARAQIQRRSPRASAKW